MIVNGICGAATDDDLLKAIGTELARLRESWHRMRVISISHSVATQGTGGFFWTALLTCDVEDEIQWEHPGGHDAMVERVLEEMR